MSNDGVIQVGLSQIHLLKGDITQIAVDAIVNAANSSLAGGGGVDGAIHTAGGPGLMEELNAIRARIGHCPSGQAVVTGAGDLPARFVFHAVGPRYRDGQAGEAVKLASCYNVCLGLAADRKLGSISFPSISTGVYGYPPQAACDIALRTVVRWLKTHTGSLRTVKLVQFSDNDHDLYKESAHRLHSEAQVERSS
jgi:O-acetyl-ADP-ribose deacetylase (regulator of RNase III)